MQFLSLLGWEIRYYTRRISTWVYFAIYFTLGFLFMLATGGAFRQLSVVLGGGGKVLANAPATVSALLTTLSLFGMSIVAAVAGNSIYRDYDARMESLVYTTPVSKGTFLGSRFVGTLIVNGIILLGLVVGMILATKTPWVQADKIAPFDLRAYAQPYFTLMMPNLLFTAAIFFALPALTREMLPNYVGGVVLLLGYLLSAQLLRDIAGKQTGALLDPFGLGAANVLTEYWSIADKNTRYVPLAGVLAANRAIWVAFGLGIFALAYNRFRFAYAVSEPRGAVATTAVVSEPARPLEPVRLVSLPAAIRRFDLRARWIQYWSITTRSFWRVVRNPYFYVIAGAGVLYMVFVSQQIDKLYGTTTWPVTYQMIDVVNSSFGLFLLVIIAFYSGELVWAERDVKIAQITDAAPVPNGIAFLAKLTALAGVLVVLLLAIMLTGIAIQAAEGYTHFEIPVYLQALLGFRFADLMLLVVLAMAIHVLVNHKYVGHLLVFVAFLGLPFVYRWLGLDLKVYQYGGDSGLEYSDMNGWGAFARPFIYWKLYWGAFAVLLAVLTNLFWVRGEETHMSWRAHLARLRFGRAARGGAAIAAIAFLALGGFLYYNTAILNHFVSGSQQRTLRAEYERRYKRYENTPQPRITAVNVAVDLTPEKGSMRVQGHYVLRNKARVPIDTIHLQVDRDLRVRTMQFDRPDRVVLADSARGWYMRQLAVPLAPGDSLVLNFDFTRGRRGIANAIEDTDLASNGTFVENAGFMPEIGYQRHAELADDDQRKTEKLPPAPRMKQPSDSSAWGTNYVSPSADWLDYEATVSTSPDQIAITSGSLQREWTQGGRRYFHYKMDSPILNLWAFQSARYATAIDHWAAPDGRVIDITVYYHPTHPWNVQRMIYAVKKSLAYYTANFGPYQHREVRIVEFPRYDGNFAQSLPNTIPYSEAVGFIARVKSDDDIDYPFYVTAHEVSHQWWAHQVIGADAAGATMLSETLAQYSALRVMEKEFGSANMRRFLEYELDRYLTGRSAERKRELPIELNENQPYIHYNKGSLVMYALGDYIGEERMNRAIRGFLNAEKFRGPPYPTSLELVDSLRAATPDSLKYIIKDLFETITLYELRADSAIATDAPNGQYRLDLYLTSRKLRADTLGAEMEIPMHDWVDIGVYVRPARGQETLDRNGVPIYLEKQLVHDGPQHITLTVAERPSRAGIDPLHKLISRLTAANTIGVQDRTKKKTSAATPRKRPTTR